MTSGQPAWAGGRFKMLQATRRGKPAVLVINEDLRPAAEAARFPWLVTLSLPLRNPGANGLCDQGESDRLAALEESLLGALDPAAFRYMGRMTWNGEREVWLYASDADSMAAVLRSGIAAHGATGAAGSDIDISSDPQWEEYARFK